MPKTSVEKKVNLKERYQEIAPKLLKEFGLSNLLALPKIEKVVVNVGTGQAVGNPQLLEQIKKSLATITGQYPSYRKARKSISGFKIKKGDIVGLTVTLRGDRMYWFLERLIKIALPRVRDFRGIPASAIDPAGNLNIGIREQTIFPEIDPDKIPVTHGLQVTVVIKNSNPQKSKILLKELGFPIKD